jgi:hypothetical protein
MAETVLVSPQFFAPHLHAVVAEALATSAGQNLKISLGSVGKTQRPLSKLRRAGDIKLSASTSSPVVAKFDASNVKPRTDSGNWQPVDSMPEFNDEVTGASDNAVAQKQIKSPSTQRATHLLGVGLSKDNAMEGLEVSRDTIKDSLLERSELRCSEGAINMLQDFNFWKEAPNAHSSSHQAGKECSCYAACSACLMPDAVNIPILKSSLRLLETQRFVGSSSQQLLSG